MKLSFLAEVRRLIHEELESSSVRDATFTESLFTGKMLRSRLAAHLGEATGVPHSRLALGAAAVEIFHTASLLHDDVIDFSFERRGEPAYWTKKGTRAAILLGDRLLVHALELVQRIGVPALQDEFLQILSEICDAQIEEAHGRSADLQSISRRKTGGLYAFIGILSSGDDSVVRQALRECGYEFGVAYQIADDIRDRAEDSRSITLADCPDSVEAHLAVCSRLLLPWPELTMAWDSFLLEVSLLNGWQKRVYVS